VSQDNFPNSYRYTLNNENYESYDNLTIEEAKAFCVEGYISQWGCFGYFRLQLADVKSSTSYFEDHLILDMCALNSVVGVSGLWVSVEKEIAPRRVNWVYVSTDDVLKTELSYHSIIGYQERVIRTWNNEDVHSFSISMEWYSQRELYSDCSIDLTFRGNLKVEHWEEYVEYGYFDWLSAMGGIMSIARVTFLWGAYHLAVLFGEKNHMGILPQISFIFDNRERIHRATER